MVTFFTYLAAIGCSLCYGLATILEQRAAKRNSEISSLHYSHLMGLFKQGSYVFGMVFDFLGWILFLLAARRLPLFLSLAFAASSLVVTAGIAHFIGAARTTRSERLAIMTALFGDVLLGIVAKPSAVHQTGFLFKLILVLAPIPIAIAGLAVIQGRKHSMKPLLLAMFAGLTFGGTGLIARTIHFSSMSIGSLLQPLVLALIGYGYLGTMFMAVALQRGNINRVNSAMFLTELSIPSIIGIVFLHDQVRAGLWGVMILGYILVIASTVILSLAQEHPPQPALKASD